MKFQPLIAQVFMVFYHLAVVNLLSALTFFKPCSLYMCSPPYPNGSSRKKVPQKVVAPCIILQSVTMFIQLYQSINMFVYPQIIKNLKLYV